MRHGSDVPVPPQTAVPTPGGVHLHTADSAMPSSPNPMLPPPHLFEGLDPNRFPPDPDPEERNSGDPSSHAAASGSFNRMYGPEHVPDNFHRNRKKDDFKRVVAKIEMSYRVVGLDGDSLESGYCCCLGLLNPVANIRVNHSIFNTSGLLNPKAANSFCALDSIFNYSSSSSPGKGGGDMAARRSLDGLIAFLSCLFPYLPVAEALAYLDAVDADPLAAAALIVTRRGCSWGLMENTTAMEMALRCGAIAAQHPDPSLLVKGWTSLSPYLQELMHSSDLSAAPHPDYNTHRRLPNEEDCNLKVQAAWELANDRLHRLHARLIKFPDVGLPPVRAAMKRMLLGKIHGFYLKALCCVPVDELTLRYHRALVMGGYCYGPLKPAANIIVNMIWYEQTFPATQVWRTSMIGTQLLWRVAARSLYGLISFLCTRYPSLTPDHAMQRLLEADADLQVADPNLFDAPSNNLKMDPQIGSGKDTVSIQTQAVTTSVLEAYNAAATAAYHPSPHAQKEFLGSPDSVRKLKCISDMVCLHDGELSYLEFGLLCSLLQRFPVVPQHHQQESDEPTVVGNSTYATFSRRNVNVARFWGLHDRVRSMVLAALREFNRTNESEYSLHVICGVNEHVSGPKFCSPKGSYPFKYQYSHINFLATRFNQNREHRFTRLFFAECNLDDGDDAWCVPVDWIRPFGGQARCFYCETHGNRIIHPSIPVFHGFDFEEAFFGSDKMFYDNDQIIFLKDIDVDWVNGVEEDIYSNYRCPDDTGNRGLQAFTP